MYRKQKSPKQENHNPKKTHRNLPSFSSTLLDEICRSIEGNSGIPAPYGETRATAFRSNTTSSSSRSDEEIASVSRACLVDKRMDSEINQKAGAKKLENSLFTDSDLRFFSCNSSSSDSSGARSSSDTEFFCSSTKSSSVKIPKSVRTHRGNNENYLFDDYQNYEKNRVEDDSIKSKSRTSNIYANLKKLKQPISPGAKLTSLINSFFSSMNRRKSKNVDKYPSSEEMRNGIKGTVRFDSGDVVDGQDSKICVGGKSLYDDIKRCDKYGRPPLPPNVLKVQEQRKCDLSMFRKIRNEDEDEDDEFSDSSSDLFELDHLSSYRKNDKFCDELPMYESTYFDRNRGLIR